MKPWQDQDRILALAGVFQAAQLIRQLGLRGIIVEDLAFSTSLQSVFKLDAPNVISIFGETKGLRVGLFSLLQFADKKVRPQDPVVLRYAINLLSVGRRVLTDKTLAQQLQRRLLPAISQANHFSATDPLVISHLSTIYRQVFLERRIRIAIQGRVQYFKMPEINDKIRALLLAGIRASVLWYQVGGNRWQLLFQRRHLQTQARQLLHEQPLTSSISR